MSWARCWPQSPEDGVITQERFACRRCVQVRWRRNRRCGMKLVWPLPVFAGMIAGPALISGPALAQGLIAPSRQYLTPKREGLDKSYGLPTFGTPGEAMPKQQAATTQPHQQQ